MVSFATRPARILRMPWWLAVTIVFIAGRVISTAMLIWFADHQLANDWTGAHPNFGDFSSIWDGRWYNLIAENGYPTILPHDAEGHVQQNSWAFLPLYPALCKLFMVLTGLDWNTVAISVSVIAAFGATLIIYKLFAHFLQVQQAFFAIILFSVAPVAPIYQVAYAESLQLLLIATALLLLVRRQYLWIIPVAILLGFTRPGALALALTLGLHGIFRYVKGRRAGFPMRERWKLIAATFASLVAGFAWAGIAGLVTGVPSAYVQTELSWRAAYVGWVELVPFTPWLQAAQYWFSAPMSYFVLAGALALFAAVIFAPASRRLGLDMRLWMFSYSVYLLAVFFPQSSTFRLLAPMFPALGMFAAPKSKLYRIVLVIVFLALQWYWIAFCWAISDYDWSPP
ncbi:MAG: hypothetical protein RLZZ600_235 [Actinomycetota bacterium]